MRPEVALIIRSAFKFGHPLETRLVDVQTSGKNGLGGIINLATRNRTLEKLELVITVFYDD